MAKRNVILATIFMLFSACPQSDHAQSSSRFTIARGVIAGGGTTLISSSRFKLAGTIGQPLAAMPSGPRFAIRGGFWIWPAPIIFAPTKIGDDFIVSIQTELGKTYTVQYTDTLSPPDWQNLPNIVGNGAVESITNSAPGVVHRYYRLFEQ